MNDATEARKRIAARLAAGNALLAEVLRMHMEYTSGRVDEPTVRSGIRFYQVGRNASHEFYIGTKNGLRFVLSVGEGEWDDDLDVSSIEDHVREVADWDDCYLGHY